MSVTTPVPSAKRRRRPITDTIESMLPLEPGDRLTRPEFERRYAAMPALKKAELNMAILQQGFASAKPADFVAALQERIGR